MKQKITKQISYWLGVIVVGLALGLGLQFVQAWTEPTTDPPGGNVGAPLNTSINDQAKSGSLVINSSGKAVGLMVQGNVGIGTVNPSDRLHVNGSGIYVTTPNAGPWAFRIRNESAPVRGLDIYQSDSGEVHLLNDAGGSNQSNITMKSGKVGVGTAQPSAKLHVLGQASGIGSGMFTNNNWTTSTGSALIVKFGSDAGNTHTELQALNNGWGGWSNLVLQSGGGSVGIGTASPAQKLHIGGGKAQADDFCLNSDPAKCLSGVVSNPTYPCECYIRLIYTGGGGHSAESWRDCGSGFVRTGWFQGAFSGLGSGSTGNSGIFPCR